jgi:hypothetical protein
MLLISSSLVWRLPLPARLFARNPPEALHFSGPLLKMIQALAINQLCFLVRFVNLLKILSLTYDNRGS